jgi:hypothetical protein
VGVSYAIKAEVLDASAPQFVFDAQKTMYGGKHIAAGDTIYIFESENAGGQGLIARGLVTRVAACPKPADVERHTPRVSIRVERMGSAQRRLGRAELKSFTTWDDVRPETELNFKFYRQATDKVVAVSEGAAAFLASFF